MPGEMQTTGRTRCEWCAAPADPGATTCPACSGPISVVEPWVLACGWCGASNRRDETARCTECGGPLPTIPGSHPGPRPPEPPRTLPRGYARRVNLSKNVHVILGMVFTLAFFWTVIFPLIGIPLWIHGHARARRTLRALVHGVATRGRLVSVTVDPGVTLNGRHPRVLTYEYDTPAGTRRAATEAWDPAHEHRPAGEHVWILYDTDAPDRSAIWPPVR